MKSTICLFDMDGTLTAPRKKIKTDMVNAIKELSSVSKIGIVTGSDFDYVMQQCSELFELEDINVQAIDIFPCNGTKHYAWNGNKFELLYDIEMIKEIGQKDYNYMIQTLAAFQLMITLKHDLPYTGTFFHYRGSMLNWCPIGRQANDDARNAWTNEDEEYGIREYFLQQIKNVINESKIKLTVALGGSTSFDIYPDGWDKTYVMNHLCDFKEVFFVGDKCQEGGNDKALYDLLLSDGRSFETHSTDQTKQIIENIINMVKENA